MYKQQVQYWWESCVAKILIKYFNCFSFLSRFCVIKPQDYKQNTKLHLTHSESKDLSPYPLEAHRSSRFSFTALWSLEIYKIPITCLISVMLVSLASFFRDYIWRMKAIYSISKYDYLTHHIAVIVTLTCILNFAQSSSPSMWKKIFVFFRRNICSTSTFFLVSKTLLVENK